MRKLCGAKCYRRALALAVFSAALAHAATISRTLSRRNRELKNYDENTFVRECLWALLDKEVRKDGEISRDEFALFLSEICDTSACENANGSESFNVPDKVLELFPKSGFPYSDESYDEVETQLSDMCTAVYPNLLGSVMATDGKLFLKSVLLKSIQLIIIISP
jgi:hypothetical protein